MRLASLTLIALVCCGQARAADPNRLPEAKPPSLWSKLLGKTSSPPLTRQMPRQRPASSRVSIDPNVNRASYEEAEAHTVMPPALAKKSVLAPLTSWWRRSKQPSRTMSEYMAEERP